MGIFLSLSYSKTFRSETINTLIPSLVPSKTIYPIPDQNGQSLYRPVFRPKRHKNPTLWGGTYLYGWYMGGPPGGIIFAGPALQRCRCSVLHWISKTWARVRVTPPNSGRWLHLQSTVLHRLFENWIRYSLSPPAGHWYQIQICISARLMSSELKTTISLFQSKLFTFSMDKIPV